MANKFEKLGKSQKNAQKNAKRCAKMHIFGKNAQKKCTKNVKTMTNAFPPWFLAQFLVGTCN